MILTGAQQLMSNNYFLGHYALEIWRGEKHYTAKMRIHFDERFSRNVWGKKNIRDVVHGTLSNMIN